mmetsp:Transcript_110643/g.247248  ORF Transcript_110643/g.247248 Transcript_110643/m.247248 type:complete len:225 (+) Transcript_110643:44-718(+)
MSRSPLCKDNNDRAHYTSGLRVAICAGCYRRIRRPQAHGLPNGDPGEDHLSGAARLRLPDLLRELGRIGITAQLRDGAAVTGHEEAVPPGRCLLNDHGISWRLLIHVVPVARVRFGMTTATARRQSCCRLDPWHEGWGPGAHLADLVSLCIGTQGDLGAGVAGHEKPVPPGLRRLLRQRNWGSSIPSEASGNRRLIRGNCDRASLANRSGHHGNTARKRAPLLF